LGWRLPDGLSWARPSTTTDLRSPRQDARDVEGANAIGVEHRNRSRLAGRGRGAGRDLGLKAADHDVLAAFAAAPGLVEHPERLADAGCVAEEDLERCPRGAIARRPGRGGASASGSGRPLRVGSCPSARSYPPPRRRPVIIGAPRRDRATRFSASTLTPRLADRPSQGSSVAGRHEAAHAARRPRPAPPRRAPPGSSALAGVMCGSRPLPDAVIASGGIGPVCRRFSRGTARTAAFTRSISFWLVGPRFDPDDAAAS
jgi:hypothetical protein